MPNTTKKKETVTIPVAVNIPLEAVKQFVAEHVLPGSGAIPFELCRFNARYFNGENNERPQLTISMSLAIGPDNWPHNYLPNIRPIDKDEAEILLGAHGNGKERMSMLENAEFYTYGNPRSNSIIIETPEYTFTQTLTLKNPQL